MPDMLERYKKAEGMLSHKVKDLVRNPTVTATWIPGTENFWYARTNDEGAREVVLDDCEKGTKAPAFDAERLAKAISVAAGDELPTDVLNVLPFELGDCVYRVSLGEARFEVALDTYEARALPSLPAASNVSPDGRFAL